MAASTGQTLTTGKNLPPPQSPFVDPRTGVLSSDGYLYLLGLINQLSSAIPTASVAPAIAAAGVSQATAAQLTDQWNVVDAASMTATGVLLASFQIGQYQVVFNVSGFAIKIWPPAGSQIDALGANVAYPLNNNKMQIFNFESASQIYSTQLG